MPTQNQRPKFNKPRPAKKLAQPPPEVPCRYCFKNLDPFNGERKWDCCPGCAEVKGRVKRTVWLAVANASLSRAPAPETQPRRRASEFDYETVKKMHALYERTSYKEVQEKYNVSNRTVLRLFKKYNLPLKGKGVTVSNRLEGPRAANGRLILSYEDAWRVHKEYKRQRISIHNLGKQLGISDDKIRYSFRHYGMPVNVPGQQRFQEHPLDAMIEPSRLNEIRRKCIAVAGHYHGRVVHMSSPEITSIAGFEFNKWSIRNEREQRGLTVSSMANLSCVSDTNIYRAERGERETGSLKSWIRLAVAFRETTYLIGEQAA